MHILYVGNGNYKHQGARYYDVGRKLCNGFTRLGHNVYFFSDRDIARASNLFGISKLGIRQCNQIFLNTCRNFCPELIVLGHADVITGESLREVRALLPQVKIIQFNVDPVFRPHNIMQILSKQPYMDAAFITTAGEVLKRFSHPGCMVSYMPNPVDASMEWPRCFEGSGQPNDVFWAIRAEKGSFDGDPRLELPLFLERSGKVRMDYHGMNGRPALYNADYFKAITQAKMGLNISVVRAQPHDPRASDAELYLYSSDRIAHYMGSGLLTFTTRDNRLEELFAPDKELVFFDSPGELLEKVLYYKEHDGQRRAIAEAGWKKSHTHYNSTLVAQYMIEKTFRQEPRHDYAWPVQAY